MKNIKLHILSLSNAILRRDKSIRYSRASITILVTSVFLLANYHIGFTNDILPRGEEQFTNDFILSSNFTPFSEQ